jgi:hypothetical protein
MALAREEARARIEALWIRDGVLVIDTAEKEADLMRACGRTEEQISERLPSKRAAA